MKNKVLGFVVVITLLLAMGTAEAADLKTPEILAQTASNEVSYLTSAEMAGVKGEWWWVPVVIVVGGYFFFRNPKKCR